MIVFHKVEPADLEAAKAAVCEAFPDADVVNAEAVDCGFGYGVGIKYGNWRWAERVKDNDVPAAIERLKAKKANPTNGAKLS